MTSNIGVARLWAFEGKPEGKSSNGNMSFSGPTAYSYSTPIASHVQAPGGRVSLVTSETYSVTTSGKHMPAIRRALREFGTLPFTVPFLLLEGSLTGRSHANALARGRSDAEQHQGNLDHYDACIREEEQRLARARTYKSRDRLDSLLAERDRYWHTFNLSDVLARDAR